MAADHVCNQGGRFDAIDQKLDQITQILVDNARTEERLKHLEAFKDRADPRIKSVEDYIARNAWVIRMGERLVWVAVLAVIAMYKMKVGG